MQNLIFMHYHRRKIYNAFIENSPHQVLSFHESVERINIITVVVTIISLLFHTNTKFHKNVKTHHSPLQL